jgi:hypothetical protein
MKMGFNVIYGDFELFFTSIFFFLRDRPYDVLNILGENIVVFCSNIASFNITLVFEKNAYFFAKNWHKIAGKL